VSDLPQQPARSIWPDDPAQLGVVQAIFAILMSFGFKTMVESIYQFARPELGIAGQPRTADPQIAFFFPNVAMVFLGLRFFWAVVNIRRYVERADADLLAGRASSRQPYEQRVVLLHIPMLILHGALFCFGAQFASDMLVNTESRLATWLFVAYYAAFQYLNSLWLWVLVRQVEVAPGSERRESFWIRNNVVASTAGIAVVTISSTLKLNHEVALAISCAIFVASSVLDLSRTAYHYLESFESRPQKT
jgi:hypothetical protein